MVLHLTFAVGICQALHQGLSQTGEQQLRHFVLVKSSEYCSVGTTGLHEPVSAAVVMWFAVGVCVILMAQCLPNIRCTNSTCWALYFNNMHFGMLCHVLCFCASLSHNKLSVSTEAKWGQPTFARNIHELLFVTTRVH